jgi:hypothetical protein
MSIHVAIIFLLGIALLVACVAYDVYRLGADSTDHFDEDNFFINNETKIYDGD